MTKVGPACSLEGHIQGFKYTRGNDFYTISFTTTSNIAEAKLAETFIRAIKDRSHK